MLNLDKSIQLFNDASDLLPGGVNSPVRAFNSVGGTPPFIASGSGAYIEDVDGNRYIDYVLSYGPLIRGHAHPAVVSALQAAAARSTTYGAPNPHEVTLAKLVREMMPNIEMMRFVNSGTEATMSVTRLARAFTGKNGIIKFKGNYHGHADFFLVEAGSGVATLGLPNSPGVPSSAVADTLVAPFNDLEAVAATFAANKGKIGALIVEPISGNMGLVLPAAGFLEGLRDLCDANDALLIFDEVMTGFRCHRGGAQALYNVKPDLTALGKVIGGGLPVGAYGGRRDIMEMVAPIGPMYQAGTLSGNPLAMVAGIETLKGIQDEEVWEGFAEFGRILDDGIQQAAKKHNIPIQLNRVGSMQGFFFNDKPVTNYTTAATSDANRFRKFFHLMLEEGIYLAPSQFEAAFISTAHGPQEAARTIAAFERTFAQL